MKKQKQQGDWHPTEAYGELTEGIQRVLIPTTKIKQRVLQMGAAISEDYRGRNPLLIGVLKGVVPFMADLTRAVTIPHEVDYMAVSSFGPGKKGPGMVRLEKDLSIPITGRDVLFVEDIIDTGLTLNYLLRALRTRDPASLEVCVLLNKPQRRLIDIPLAYKGFDLPDRLVVGYGLDFREHYRNLPFVGLLKPEVFQNDVKS